MKDRQKKRQRGKVEKMMRNNVIDYKTQKQGVSYVVMVMGVLHIFSNTTDQRSGCWCSYAS